MTGRHRTRRLALQGLCCLDVQGPDAMAMVGRFLADSREPAETVAAANRMLAEALEDRDACDALLTMHAKHWRLERLAMVDRNVLRLGVHEMLQGRTPPRVVITEAIRLAEEFSTADSARFVNGVLDAVHKQLESEMAGPSDRASQAPLERESGQGPAESGEDAPETGEDSTEASEETPGTDAAPAGPSTDES